MESAFDEKNPEHASDAYCLGHQMIMMRNNYIIGLKIGRWHDIFL